MSTQPTNNPVPSESPRDLKFNAGKIDEFVTSLAMRYTDRFGYQHYTIEGVRQLAYDAISGFGWVLRESFEDGATLTLPNDALLWESNGEYYRWAGALPKTVPANSTPESSGGIGEGAWIGIGDAALKTMLSSSAGASMIGMAAGGTLQQIIQYVTPEQFGAIGDGTVHPLSERYTTLAAAKAVYPHVTALTQTIDWAACQGAENYARGVTAVKCPWFAKYHFGSSDYLSLGINSKWEGGKFPQTDMPSTTMIRLDPASSPAFGQDCIVRVMNGKNTGQVNESGSTDEFVRGVLFKGFKLTRNLVRRPDVRGKNSIGLHLNTSMKAEIDVTINGCDFGIIGYGCWGVTGIIRIDSCHKGIYFDGWNTSPEWAGGMTLTSFNIRAEIDACVFPIYLAQTTYSIFTGFFEGMLDTYTTIYKSAIETACGITLDSYCNNITFNMGIEAFQGTHMEVGGNNNIDVNFYYLNDRSYNSLTGTYGAKAQIDLLMSRSTRLVTSSARAFYFAHGLNNSINLQSPIFYGSNIMDDSGYVRYIYNMATGNRLNGFGGNINQGPLLQLTRTRFSIFRAYGVRNILADYFPSGYTPIGEDICIATSWTLQAIGSDGRAILTAPTGYKIMDFSAHTVVSSTSQATSAAPLGLVAYTDASVTLQTPLTATGFSVAYKLTLQVTK